MAMVATYPVGHPQHGEIIASTNGEWQAVAMYTNGKLLFLQIDEDILEDEEVTEIEDLGTEEGHLFNFNGTLVPCRLNKKAKVKKIKKDKV